MNMKYRYSFLLLCMFCFIGCLDEIEDLETPFLEQNTDPLIEIASHSYDANAVRMRVDFTVFFDFSQNEFTEGIAVFRDGQPRFRITDPDQLFFIDAALPAPSNQVCYKMAFYTTDDDYLPFTDLYCIQY